VQIAVRIATGRVYALRNVRVYFKKKDRLKFVSHLDMNRFMARSLKKAGIPIWYTEGFHPHPYTAFALPLSLGFESDYEILDIRLIDDNYPSYDLIDALNKVFPKYVRVISASEPIMKVGKIAFADFKITFEDNGALSEQLKQFLNQDSIICEKKTKRGNIKEIDLIPKIKEYSLEKEDNTILTLKLPAGSEDNLNPELLLNAFFEKFSDSYYSYSIVRTMIYDRELNQFR